MYSSMKGNFQQLSAKLSFIIEQNRIALCFCRFEFFQ